MNEFERINAPRVEKMIAILETIRKSGRSNNATSGEYADLLEPLTRRTVALTTEAASFKLPIPQPQPTQSRWQDIDDMINSLDAKDLDLALSKIAVRIGDYFYERGYK